MVYLMLPGNGLFNITDLIFIAIKKLASPPSFRLISA